jgi:uncharacterized Zn-binding protein involved in type VI secretion
MQKIALSLAAGLLALAAAGADAQTLWKWRDASGQMHVSDTPPPPGTPARNIVSGPPIGTPLSPGVTTTSSSTTTTTSTAPAASAGDSALDKKKKAADKEKADKDAADRAAVDAKNAAIRKDNCTRAQSTLAGLQSGQRMARINPNGEREVLDDAARAEEIKRTQDVVSNSCGAAPAQ